MPPISQVYSAPATVLAFGFVNPWILFGLALGGLPILIHLLYRQAYRETEWAAMRFLLEAARKNSRRLRLEQLVLLVVRTLLLLLPALAFAQPVFRAVTGEPHARTPLHRVIVIDASFSMAERGDRESRFDRAKKLARQIVSGSLAGDAINLLRIADRSSPAIVREPAFDREPVLSEIDRLEVTDERGELRPALAQLEEILADSHAPKNKEVVFLSDFQRTTWTGDSAEHSDLHETFERIAARARIALIDVGDHRDENAAVTALQTAEPVVLADRPARLLSSIRNFGATPLQGTRVELYVDGYLAASKTVDLAAGEETSVEFPYEFHSAGEHVAEVRTPPDRLFTDNQRWLSVPVAEQMNVLIVNGRQGGRPAENASYYVRTVLAPSTRNEAWSGPTRPKVINEADLAAEDLARYDCVFLCNVGLVTRTEAALLQAYAEGGGGIVFAVGDRVKAENYNDLLYRGGKGVLPVPLGSRVGDARNPGRGFTFDVRDLSHPITAPFRGNPRAGLNRSLTMEYLQTLVPAGSTARVVLRFDSGDPALVERQIGRGRAVLLTTSCDVSWSTWSVMPTFPPIIHETVRFAAQGRWHERQRLVGEPLARPLAPHETGLSVVVKPPGGGEQVVRPVTSESQSEVIFSETNRRGIYELILGTPPADTSASKSAAGANIKSAVDSAARHQGRSVGQRELYAVNVDTRESDLETVDEKTLGATTLAGIPFIERGDWSESPRDSAEAESASSGIAAYLLLLTLALLLVEPLLAWSFRHGLGLLCTLVAVGLALPVLPHGRWGGLIIGLLLTVGIGTTLLLASSARAPETTLASPSRGTESRFVTWLRLGRGRNHR